MFAFIFEVLIITIALLFISITFAPLFIILGAVFIILIIIKDFYNVFGRM